VSAASSGGESAARVRRSDPSRPSYLHARRRDARRPGLRGRAIFSLKCASDILYLVSHLFYEQALVSL